MIKVRLASVGMLWLAATAVHAQAPAQQASQCFPPCRTGFLCAAGGQCVSACNPPCGAGQICAGPGQCVSACNPACAAGQACSADGQCVPQAPAQGTASPAYPQPTPAPGQPAPAPVQSAPAPPAPVQSAPAPPAQSAPTYAQPAPAQPAPSYAQPAAPPYSPQPAAAPSTGWARGAAIAGYIGAGVVALNAGIAIGLNEEGDEGGRIPGVIATATVGILGPVVAIGGGSARRAGVRGIPVVRVLSWIGYGLTLANAIFLIALSFDEEVSSAHIASVGGLGVVSLIGFSVDASVSASQASALQAGPAATLAPRLTLHRERDGSLVPTLGVAGAF